MLGELSPWHLLILAAVVLVLFGAKRLPDSARSLGRAMRIFKSETSGLRGDDTTDTGQPQAAPPGQLTPPKDDGTLVNGVPLSESQRPNQPG
jgi:sec-independent protein translocase protein TatA